MSGINDLLRALERIRDASPGSTNSEYADEAFSWTNAVAAEALATWDSRPSENERKPFKMLVDQDWLRRKAEEEPDVDITAGNPSQDEQTAIKAAIRKALTEEWRDVENCRGWTEDVLLTGCRKVGGGKGYEHPEQAADSMAGCAADAILARLRSPASKWQQRLAHTHKHLCLTHTGLTFDLRKQVTFGEEYNQAVKDGIDAIGAACDTIADILLVSPAPEWRPYFSEVGEAWMHHTGGKPMTIPSNFVGAYRTAFEAGFGLANWRLRLLDDTSTASTQEGAE